LSNVSSNDDDGEIDFFNIHLVIKIKILSNRLNSLKIESITL